MTGELDPRLDRDARRYRALVGLFAALTLLFGAVLVAAIDDETTDGVASASTGTAATEQPDAGATGTTSTSLAAAVAATGAPSARPTATAVAGSATPLAAGEEIVVGSVVSETGPVSFPQVAAALRSYFADLNARGGINGHPVRLELLDDGLDTNRSRQAFHRLASDPKVLAVVGSFAPLGEPDGVAELDKAGIPIITASGLAPTTFSATHAWFLTSTLENYGRVGCGEALRRGQKRVALVYVNSEQIAPIISGYRECIESHGGAVLEEQTQLGQPDYTATALRIGQFKADVVFHELAQSASVQLWQAMDRQGVRAASQLVPGSDIPIILDYSGPAGQDVTIQTNVQPPHVRSAAMDRIKSVVEKYQPGVGVTSLAVDKWLGAELFTLVAQLAGNDLTRERIQAEMAKVVGFDGGGLVPPITYGPDRHTTAGLFFFFDKEGDHWGTPSPARGPA